MTCKVFETQLQSQTLNTKSNSEHKVSAQTFNWSIKEAKNLWVTHDACQMNMCSSEEMRQCVMSKHYKITWTEPQASERSIDDSLSSLKVCSLHVWKVENWTVVWWSLWCEAWLSCIGDEDAQLRIGFDCLNICLTSSSLVSVCFLSTHNVKSVAIDDLSVNRIML